MKRQRPSTKDLTLEDVLEFLQTSDFSTDDLLSLGQEIDRLYAIKANNLAQHLPSDLWLTIISHTRSRLHTDFSKYSAEITLQKPQEFRFWLNSRTVSKSWHSIITSMDFSSMVPLTPPVGIPDAYALPGGFHVSRILELFKFSRLSIPLNWDPRDSLGERIEDPVSLLTGVKALQLDSVKNLENTDKFQTISRLTGLTGLYLYKDVIPQEALLQLTNLRSLTLHLDGDPKLKELSTLTNLETLEMSETTADLFSQSYCLKTFPKLKDIILFQTIDNYFQEGRGTSWVYEDGEIYTGEWFKGRRHGFGRCYDDDAFEGEMTEYLGQWSNHKKQGKGVYKHPTGARYEGDWDNNEATAGRCVFANGDSYNGTWQRGFFHGQGVYQFVDGRTFTGVWDKGKLPGHTTKFQNFPFT